MSTKLFPIKEANRQALKSSEEIYNAEIERINGVIQDYCRKGAFECIYRFDPELMSTATRHQIVRELFETGYIRDFDSAEQAEDSNCLMHKLCWDDIGDERVYNVDDVYSTAKL